MNQYPVYQIKDVVAKERDGVVLSWREPLQEEALEKLHDSGIQHIIITDDKTATFM